MTSVWELLQQPFVIRSLIVIVVLSSIFPLYGNIVLIRRQSNIAHTFAHMGLLGVAVAMMMQRPVLPTVIGAMMLTVVGLIVLSKTQSDSSDATNEILAQMGLVGAIIIASQLTGYRADLSSYLFGDIVLITQSSLWQVVGICVVLGVVYALAYRYRMQSSLDTLIARTKQSHPQLYNIVYLMMIGLLVAGSIQVVGVLLVSALLILPSHIARLRTTSFTHRQIGSIVVALITSVGAVILSLWLNIPTGATIVGLLLLVYGVSLTLRP